MPVNPIQNVKSLPIELLQPGLLSGGGLNRGAPRIAIPLGSAWNLINAIPTNEGYDNKNIGITKLNDNLILSSPVQGGAVFNGYHIYVKNGNVYKLPLAGGMETLIEEAVFSTSSRVMFAKAVGTSTQKLYMCDGTVTPKSWDGSALADVSAFNATILSTIPSTEKPDKVIFFKERLVWSYPETSDYKSYVLFSKLLDADNYAGGGSLIDALFEACDKGDNEGVRALATIKRNLETEQAEQIVAFKATKSYIADTITLPSGTPTTSFQRQAIDMGAINQFCVENWNNTVITLNTKGFASLDSATFSGGVDAKTYETGLKVNSLVQDSAKNINFDQSFSVHCPNRQEIWVFIPESESSSNFKEGIAYPEIPMGRTLCFKYGITYGNQLLQWYERSGAGWGFKSAWIEGDNIYLGSYFGDVYVAYSGQEYERNPAALDTEQLVTSIFETGDMVFENGIDYNKMLVELREYWKQENSVVSTTCFYFNQKDDGICYTKITESVSLGVYGIGIYGTDVYSFPSNKSLSISPTGIGTTIRIKVSWDSRVLTSSNLYKDNIGALQGFSGRISYGNRFIVGNK